MGFLAVDHLSRRVGAVVDQKKKKTLYGKCLIDDMEVILLKPQTFMNLSGEAVLYMASFLKIPPQDIIVICDDVALPFGTIRIRESGSDGGHNGLKSLITSLDSSEFPRVRIGVDAPATPDQDLREYVLEPFTQEERERLPGILERVTDALLLLAGGKHLIAMSRFNGPLPEPV